VKTRFNVLLLRAGVLAAVCATLPIVKVIAQTRGWADGS
jgi:hypothetical protein